ncbi:MAG: helix-turn-helix transcriptional regulator [Acidobacteria bacterium]|nr:helix-turn-helix transcriptional regulator [Acidobacteriota bacterium]
MTTSPTVALDWVPDLSSFAARMALVRHSMGWNLKEASVKAGLTVNAWARYEEGMRPRDLVEVVEKVTRATGVNRTWLAFGYVEPPGGIEPPTYSLLVSDLYADRAA